MLIASAPHVTWDLLPFSFLLSSFGTEEEALRTGHQLFYMLFSPFSSMNILIFGDKI